MNTHTYIKIESYKPNGHLFKLKKKKEIEIEEEAFKLVFNYPKD